LQLQSHHLVHNGFYLQLQHPVVYEIRKLNKLDVVIEGKIHYELNDGSVVAISEATQENLNNLLQNQKEIIDYMRESKENFIHVVEKLEE